MAQAAKILDRIGIGGERVKMYNLSSGEGPRFAEIATEMTNKSRNEKSRVINKKARDIK